jgi:hypothetical protein
MDYLLFFVRVVSSLVGHFGLNSRVDLDIAIALRLDARTGIKA